MAMDEDRPAICMRLRDEIDPCDQCFLHPWQIRGIVVQTKLAVLNVSRVWMTLYGRGES